MNDITMLDRLWNVIEDRKANPKEESYTCRLLNKGTEEIAKKVGEEAIEVIVAMANDDRDQVAYEAADLLYHLWVALAHSGITPADVYAQLESRYQAGSHKEE